MINEQEKYDVLTGMRVYGGSFVKALAGAIAVADAANKQKIKDTWPEYWDKYREMGRGLENKPAL